MALALDLVRKTPADQRALTGADAPMKTLTAKVDLRQRAEQQWRELFGDQRAVTSEPAFVTEVVQE